MHTSRRSSSRSGAQVVRVVLVERVDDARHDLVLGAVQLDDRALALDAVARLEVVLVLETRLGPGTDDRVGDGVAHAVGFKQEPAAQAIAPFDRLHFVELANDHQMPLLVVVLNCAVSGTCPRSVEQSTKVLDHVASVGLSGGDTGDARAAHDRCVGADRSEVVDVALVLDPEADGDRHVGVGAQRLHDGDERAVIGRTDGAAAPVRRRPGRCRPSRARPPRRARAPQTSSSTS